MRYHVRGTVQVRQEKLTKENRWGRNRAASCLRNWFSVFQTKELHATATDSTTFKTFQVADLRKVSVTNFHVFTTHFIPLMVFWGFHTVLCNVFVPNIEITCCFHLQGEWFWFRWMLDCCWGENVTIIFPATTTSASFSVRFSYPKNGEGALRKGFEIFLSNVISIEEMWRLVRENPVAEQIKLWKWKWFAQT